MLADDGLWDGTCQTVGYEQRGARRLKVGTVTPCKLFELELTHLRIIDLMTSSNLLIGVRDL